MNEKITVKNPTRSRKWGYGWSCNPSGEDAYSITPPERPDYTGTIKQLSTYIGGDITYRSVKRGGAFTCDRLFYNNRPIIAQWKYGMLSPGNCNCSYNVDYEGCNCFYDLAIWGYGWFDLVLLDLYDDMGDPLHEITLLVGPTQ